MRLLYFRWIFEDEVDELELREFNLTIYPLYYSPDLLEEEAPLPSEFAIGCADALDWFLDESTYLTAAYNFLEFEELTQVVVASAVDDKEIDEFFEIPIAG